MRGCSTCQDSIDALRLAKEATPDEIDRSRVAVRLISERGDARDKRLDQDLDDLMDRVRSVR